MRGARKCGSCQWFEDKSEEFRERFVKGDGFCHWRCPATVAENFEGWGDWHQKGPALVRKEDWCSCWDKVVEHHINVEYPKLSSAGLRGAALLGRQQLKGE